MAARVNGIHHVTSGVSAAQEDIDFFTRVVGQRMTKQTVLFDGEKPIYHLYYANKHAQVGSVMTTFPMRQAGLTGRRGTGQIQTTAHSAPVGSLKFWMAHLDEHDVTHGEIYKRFGQKRLCLSHPGGLEIDFVEDADDKTEGWTTTEISDDAAIRGFHSVVMSVRDTEEQERFFVDGLGFTKHDEEGAHTRFHSRPMVRQAPCEKPPTTTRDSGTRLASTASTAASNCASERDCAGSLLAGAARKLLGYQLPPGAAMQMK